MLSKGLDPSKTRRLTRTPMIQAEHNVLFRKETWTEAYEYYRVLSSSV